MEQRGPAGIDVDSVDLALTTTRAVRRRLDLDRPVDHQLVLDCIDVAEQAPTGGNQSSRRWIVVRDPAVRQRLAELYRDAGGQWMIDTDERLAGSGHPNEKVMASAAHLARHLADVPVLVIPTILGTHDGSGRPGLFDSILQSVWSFCVALRARGLGTAWTTVILDRAAEMAELLDLPEGYTPVALLPVAWTRGTDFRPAPRLPAREITYVDRFAHTWEHGPGDPPSLADGPGTVVEVDIDAPPAAVWPHLTDIGFGAAFSEEFLGARWDEGFDGPAEGARFIGSNVHPAIGEWEVTCWVDRCREPEEFGWVTSDPENPGARWRFQATPIAGATRLRFSLILGPGPSGITRAIEAMPDKEPRILSRRVDEHRANMTRVVEGIKAAAEGGASDGGAAAEGGASDGGAADSGAAAESPMGTT